MMKELIKNEVLKTLPKGDEQINDDAIEYIADRINAILDIPLINEAVEKIVIQAIIKIIYNLLFLRKDLVTLA